MQICPQCKHEFPDDIENCPNDGATLLPPEGLFSFQPMPIARNGVSDTPRQPRPAPISEVSVPEETVPSSGQRRRQRLRQPIDPRIAATIAAGVLLVSLIVVNSQRHPVSPPVDQVMPINPTLTTQSPPPETTPNASVTEIHPASSSSSPFVRVGTPETKSAPTVRRTTTTHSVSIPAPREAAPILPVPVALHPVAPAPLAPMPVKLRPRVHVTYHLAATPSAPIPSKVLPITVPIVPKQTPRQEASVQIAQTVVPPQATVPSSPPPPPVAVEVPKPAEPVIKPRVPTPDAIPFSVGHGIGSEWGPRHIVYVLDISASMPTRIDRAKRELGKALQSLGSEESFDVIAFDAQTQWLSDGLLSPTPDKLDLANEFLNSLRLGPGTNLEAALTQALAIPGVNNVVVVTDGVPTVGEGNFTKLARLVRRHNTVHARIYTVGLVGRNPDGTDDSFEAKQLLDQIARESGGESHIIPLGTASP